MLQRRVTVEPPEPYVLGDLLIAPAARRVTLAGSPVALLPPEYRLLERVWGERGSGDLRPLRSNVSKLRGRLGDEADRPTYVFTEPRVGYWMPAGETREQE
ncbi:MAG: hypothetical protein F4X65_07665 [Chloroflexi bacterium]|nr:hypothetical protein [Chloroflexota bacterium]